jgi:O-antigen ligase
MMTSKYNLNIPFYLIAAVACSFVFSLFLLQVFAAIVGLLWLFEKNKEKKKAFDLLTISVLAFGITRLITAFFSEFPKASSEIYLKEALFYLFFFSANFYLKLFSPEKRSDMIRFFLVAAVAASLTGIISFNLNFVERAQSFSSGYTVFSSYLLAVLPLLIFFPIDNNIKKNQYLRISGIIIIAVGIITSLGRTSVAIAALFFIVGIALKKFRFIDILAVSFAVALFSILSFHNNSLELQGRIGNPVGFSDRDVLYKGAKEILFTHPVIGYGPHTFKNIFPLFNEVNDKGIGGWHNEFLQIYFDSGVLGLLSFLFLIVVVYYLGIRLLKNRVNRDIVIGLLLSVTSFIISAFTSGFITSPVLSVLFVFIITMLNSYNSRVRDIKQTL